MNCSFCIYAKDGQWFICTKRKPNKNVSVKKKTKKTDNASVKQKEIYLPS